jgi:hypothetical protein
VFSLLYMALTAKAVSLRRLCIIYAFAFVLTCGMLELLSVRQAAHVASMVATGSVLLIWLSPLVRTMWVGLKTGSVRSVYFDATSVTVQFTYGAALAVMPLIAMATLQPSTIHSITVSTLSRVVVLAVVAGLCFPLTVRSLCRLPKRVVKGAASQTRCRTVSYQSKSRVPRRAPLSLQGPRP